MKKNKLLIFLIIALILAVGAYFYFKKKAEKQAALVTPGNPSNAGNAPAPSPHYTPAPIAPVVALPAGKFPLKYGSTGKAVQMMQVIVAMKPDGVWGTATDTALRRAFPALNTTPEIGLTDFLQYVLVRGGIQSWPLATGSAGNYVKALQIMLGVKIDGKFGPNTAGACVKALGHPTCSQAEFRDLVSKMLNS